MLVRVGGYNSAVAMLLWLQAGLLGQAGWWAFFGVLQGFGS
jgi:hypothetical protein